MSLHPLCVGAPAPRFEVTGEDGRRIGLDSLAGRYLILAFAGRAAGAEAALKAVAEAGDVLDGPNRALCWIGVDPADRASGVFDGDAKRIGSFWDFDLSISRSYGIATAVEGGTQYHPVAVLLDPRLRILQVAPLSAIDKLLEFMKTLPPPSQIDGILPAPVLVVPRVFEPELCRSLIHAFEAGEKIESGFMRQFGDKTVRVLDSEFKRRSDVEILDKGLRESTRERLSQRLVPEVNRAFQFQATRIERYIVSRYDATSGGFFKPHRDNTTSGTAHRKFAVTINLNAEEYEGGDLRFPEFGETTYRAPTGGAVVFSCSLMHEATPVTEGARFAFLPFLYDEAGAKIREENLASVAPMEAS